MRIASLLDSSANWNKVIAWFIRLRWIACIGVLVALLTVDRGSHYELPYRILYLLNGLLFLVNSLFTLYFFLLKHKSLSNKEMRVFLNVQICSDYIILFFLIYFTGFLENPFSYYFVFHIMLTAFIFSPAVVFIYVSILIVVFIGVFFAEYFQLISHYSLSGLEGSYTYVDQLIPRAIGLCSTLIISAYLITSIKKRIEEKGKRVEVELDRYKSLDKIKSNFILQVTHELRGPIAAMNGYHEMILRGITGETGPQTRQTIRKANRRTENLLTIIDEMIDYAYMKSEEEVRLTKTELLLKEIIGYNIDFFAHRAEEKGLPLLNRCPNELKLWANRDLLNIILNNLLSNAIRYSPAGKSITISAAVERGKVHLSVQDEGMGIGPDEMEEIFEEFYRSRRAREIERDGTGLGLPIVKRAVESLQGSITVYSELENGTIFHIYLPVKPEQGGVNGQKQDTHHR